MRPAQESGPLQVRCGLWAVAPCPMCLLFWRQPSGRSWGCLASLYGVSLLTCKEACCEGGRVSMRVAQKVPRDCACSSSSGPELPAGRMSAWEEEQGCRLCQPGSHCPLALIVVPVLLEVPEQPRHFWGLLVAGEGWPHSSALAGRVSAGTGM